MTTVSPAAVEAFRAAEQRTWTAAAPISQGDAAEVAAAATRAGLEAAAPLLAAAEMYDVLTCGGAAIRRLVTAGVRNGEIHRRAARPLLESVGFTADEARDIIDAAEEGS